MARRRLLPLAVVTSIISIMLVACGGGATPAPATAQPTSPEPPPPAATPTSPASSGGSGATTAPSGKQVNITLTDLGGSGTYAFDPGDMTFASGETVTFNFTSETEYHTFTVDALGIDEGVEGGATSSLTVTFDAPGTYELVCLPHEASGMVGTITVK